ncbi:hypothetical protein ANN_04639 [Periplaneta americana]|uniref:C-type lectin domain-containing protein n=1 Tax=Periplaneta americana TaxID=6978 RepID=A0ABQ8T8Y9_PERAM|nr:hypothetical protein ANN_04639 [Periplaneta americana]
MVCRAAVQDSAPCTRSNGGKFTLISRRNDTGHWIAEVRVDHSADDARGPWEIDVEHSSIFCGDSETISVQAMITVPYRGLTWREAVKACSREGAHLAIINSETESSVLQSLFARHPKLNNVSDQNHAFLGYHDLHKEGTFITVFGNALNTTGFLRWADSTQPNNAKSGPDPDSDCGGIHRNGGLNDLPCNWKVSFFCEQPL